MTESTLSRLMELKECPTSSTWFDDHKKAYKELCGSDVSDVEHENFITGVYRPYIQGVTDHIRNRLNSCDTVSAFSLFDPRHSPGSKDCLSNYGNESLQTLTNFNGKEQKVIFDGETDIDETKSEWKISAVYIH